MKPGPKNSLRFALTLAALWLLMGCGPYPLQPYQAQPYPAAPYPALPAWGPQAGAPVPPGARGAWFLPEVEERVFRLTNDLRRQSGVSALRREGGLTAVCQAYCADMLRRRFFGHTNPEGLTAAERLRSSYPAPLYGWGENLWEGANLSAADTEALARRIMNSWRSSPEHRRNILDPAYTHLGVGVAAAGGEIRAAQLFATLLPSP